MGPSNDHELEIARQADILAGQGELSLAAGLKILGVLDFRLSNTDHDFLRRYIQWRIENPIVK
jgi:hypothetical protein